MSQFQSQKTTEKISYKKRSKTNGLSFNYLQQNQQISNFEKEKFKKKKWDQIIKKVGFNPEFEEFYKNYPVKPGFYIWELLATYHKSLKKLDIRIPETLVILGNNNYKYLYYDEEKKGIFRKNELEITVNDFEKICVNKLDQRYLEEDYYLFVQRRPGRFENEVSKSVFTRTTWQSQKSMSGELGFPSLLQQFIYPRSQNASIIRFCYKTHNYSKLDSSYGFKITNNIQIHSRDHRKGISQKSTLCKDLQGSFQVTNMSKVALEQFEKPSAKLVKFLEKSFQIRIEEIVLDFIQDSHQRNILFNVKSIKMKKKKTKIQRLIESRKQNLNELSCSVYCKLCGLLFKKDEASKTLTYKLLWEFCKHLKKRGQSLNDIDFNHSSTRPCRVCDLCYMAVVSEHELIELEQQFALMQNIPIKDLYQKVPAEKPAKNRPALLKSKLKQWRLMIYLKEIQFQKSQKIVYQKLKKPFYILLKLSSINSTFKVKLDDNFELGDNVNFSLQILRVFYFFSETLDVKEFLQDSEIEIQFSQKTDWENRIAHGSSRTINKFKHNTPNGQKHEAQVYMFFQNQEVASLKIMVGLVNDGEHNTSQMNMYKHKNVYFPDNDFYNCNSFPVEWIEIFQDDFRTNKEDQDNYTPFCNTNELKKMLEGKLGTKRKTLKEFRNTTNLYQNKDEIVTINKSNEKGSTTCAQTRTASAYPNLFQNKKIAQKSSYKIKTQKFENKPQSSQNPKSFNSKMKRWFSTKLKEEDDLYNDYLKNLEKYGIQNKEEIQKDEQDLINKYLDKSRQEID